MANKGANLSFINGVPELLILRLLEGREMYGYEIVQAIGASTKQVIDAGEGCVYPLLHAMEKRGWVTSRRKTRDGRTRIYYRLSEKGKTQLQETVQRWTQITAAVNGVLGGAYEPMPNV
jgi:PadR family transcriptional regulator PadR